ncbi:hypothetical protein AC51_0989 [Escherichia coli 5-172-05_S3_C3]|nr:hypothetical protein AC51_0989 [Escherichia coli 5-172-05_S3_C3]
MFWWYRDLGPVESHYGDLLCNTELVGFISISELEYAMVVTAMKLGMSFRILSMTINLSRLTTGAMNNNAGHE